MRVAPAIVLTEDQERTLQQWSRGRSLPARQVERARVRSFGGSRKAGPGDCCGDWHQQPESGSLAERFLKAGLAGLEKDAPRPGRTPSIPKTTVDRVIKLTTLDQPHNATHWSTRTMAAAVAISAASVRRIWRANGLKPHLIETFKISKDPRFAEKLEGVVGLYLNPPSMPWCCAAMRRARSKRSIGHSPVCR